MKKLFTMVLTLMLVITLQARDNGQFFKKLSGMNVAVENVEQRFAQWFTLPEGTEWREVGRTTDLAGMERIEYRQYVAGVEVEHSQILLHAKDGLVLSANGMVMDTRRSPARIRQHSPLLKHDGAKDGRQLYLVNTPDGFRYAYKVLSKEKNTWFYYDAETQEEIKRVPLYHRLSADDGTPIQVGATTLYSGNVTLDASKAADGSTYLYDAQRNIHTFNIAYVPSFDDRIEMGTIWDYFPRGNMPEDPTEATELDAMEWIDYITELLKTNGIDRLSKYILDFARYITNKPDEEYSAYKVSKITLNSLTYRDEEGELQPFVPTTEFDENQPFLYLNFRVNVGVEPETVSPSAATQFGFSSYAINAFPHEYSPGSFIAHIPAAGGTLYVRTPIMDMNEEEEEGESDDDDDIFNLALDDDEDDDDDEEETIYDTLAVVPIVPDATGKIEFSNERLSFTLEYEKAGDPAADVHWGMARTLDFYKEVFGRNSYDGQGSPVYNLIYTHDDNAPSLFSFEASNAAALGTNSPYPMLYGMGSNADGETSNAVVEISVMAHEFTHLITDQTACLEYKGESGALNESFSDIFGISVKKYCKNSTDWYIGEGVLIDYKKDPISNMRDMANPKNTMDGNNPTPDTYEGEYWIDPETNSSDHGGVHNNSSVQNKWFYLITDGAKGTNDNGFAYDVTGIGIEKSRRIAYLTLTSYATSESDYAAIREASLEATAALYGASGQEAKTVADAWDAVGVAGSPLTSIEKMYENERQAGRIFDLQGRRLPELPTESGIYIVDGQKVIVK